MFFRKNPREISYNPGIAEEAAETIRNAASKVVYDSLAKWFVEIPDDPGTGITPVKDNHFVVYPNPASEYVDIQSDIYISELKLFAEDGRLVWLKTNMKVLYERISLSALGAGLYFIQIVDNEGNTVKKKIIKK